jgi:threonine dehydrogenase-like Zn-dependent dehydrogenase
VAEVPDPVPAPDEVVVEVDACGLCGSDVHTLHNGQAADGQILGHEFSGRIAVLGRDVTGWRTGQPVAASPLGSCGKCRICARGLAFRCPAAPNIGISRQGAYAQYVAVPTRQLVALPEELPLETGTHAEPLSVAMQAVGLSGAGPGDPVLVYGVGPIGLYAIMALRLAGACAFSDETYRMAVDHLVHGRVPTVRLVRILCRPWQ